MVAVIRVIAVMRLFQCSYICTCVIFVWCHSSLVLFASLHSRSSPGPDYWNSNAVAVLPRRVGEGAAELYHYSVRVRSTKQSCAQSVMVGWAPRSLPLDSPQNHKVGFYANAHNGNVTSYHQPGATIAQPPPALQGQLPQGGIILCEYDRARGTIGFGWAGKAVTVSYTGVPREPQLLPAFCLYYVGDCVELV